MKQHGVTGVSPVWVVIPLVWLFFFLALNSLMGDSPTMDEQNHIARGLAFLRTGDPRLSLEHPPLVNTISALPLLTLPDIRLPTDHPSWQAEQGWYEFADLLLWQYNHDVSRMVFLARLPIVFLALGLALAGYRVAGRLWGHVPALLAFFLLLFDPNLLAHGHYTTTDVGGTLFAFLATFLLWRLWRAPGWAWRRWLWAGIGLGLAFGSKLSTLAFVPIWAVLAVLPLYGRAWRWRAAGRRLLQLVGAGLVSLPVVWAIFGFEWRSFRFQTEPWLALNAFSGPMPTFWAGLEQILNISGGGRPAFLLGQFSADGFVAYFPVAFLVKTPIPTLLLLLVAAFTLLKEKETRARALFLLLPPLLYFLLSMQSALNIGYRHLLPILPFLFVLISGLGAWLVGGWRNRPALADAPPSSRVARPWRHLPLLLSLLVAAAMVSLLLSDLFIHPHYLSYFNALAGGPENGYNILIDSNIDWGQDLLRLKEWMAGHGVEEVKLAWFGTADPRYYDIKHQPLPGVGRHRFYSLWGDPPFDPQAPAPGIYAISVTSLWELPLPSDQKVVFPWFRARQPDARVGYSILIYDVP